jgi:hypothetical protein
MSLLTPRSPGWPQPLPRYPCSWNAVQHECIPQAILGMDVICQAKSGMGKTAVFTISVLQQLEATSGEVGALVMCHTRELAYQARDGGTGGAGLLLAPSLSLTQNTHRRKPDLPRVRALQRLPARPERDGHLRRRGRKGAEGAAEVQAAPHRRRHPRTHQAGTGAVARRGWLAMQPRGQCGAGFLTPPPALRCQHLTKDGDLNLKSVRHFVLDECDKMLEALGASLPCWGGAKFCTSLTPPSLLSLLQTCVPTSRRSSSGRPMTSRS